jgi:hypothetical protein
MFDASTFLLTLLRSRARDLIYVVELYAHTYEPFPEPASGNLSYDPRHAVKRYAGQNISFDLDGDTVTYESQILDLSSINKHIGKKFDTASLTLSNVDRTSAAFVLNQKIAGMRMVVRMIPRSAPSGGGEASCFQHSIILYVGRVDKPDSFNREEGIISATQDLGTIAAQIPPDQFQVLCPLTKVYKVPGGDCMGNETLDQKSATYKADKLCGGTFAECTAKSNTEFYQGLRIVQIESSFVHKSNESFFKKVLNILPGISRRKTVVGNSIHDGGVYGQVIPIVLGRWLMKLIPLQFQDIGTSINFKMAACRGTIKDFLNIRNESSGFTQPLGVTEHLGEYGGTGTQTADTVFADASFHSKLAYITGFCNGSDIETEDPAPQIVSLIAGMKVDKAFGIDGSGTGRVNNVLANYTTGGSFDWTDNPVDLARFVITEPALLNIPDSHIGELATVITSAYTTGAIKDVTNAERAIFPNSEVSKAGVDYKRYNSTGLIGARSFVGLNGVPDREAIYEFDTDGSLEDGTSTLPLKTVYRKRYTAGIVLNEPKKAIDFLYDTLYPSFRGFNRWDHFGRLVIDCERPADHSYLRANAAIAATSIKVLDVTRWKPLDVILNLQAPLRGKVLIGAHKLTSEVRPVSSADYSADGNSITLAAVVTGALQVDVSGATLSGGSTVSPASGYVDILGNPQFGEQITITIDGVAVVYTATQEDEDFNTGPSLPFQLACMINAEPLLNQYIEAQYGSSPADVDTDLDGSWRVNIFCKYGVLNFTTPLQEAHLAEIDDPTVAPTLASSAGALAAGAYLVSYAYRNANGNTNYSPIASITLTASKQIDVTGISLPAGADSADWFVSVEAGSGTMLLVNNNNGSGFSINALPESTADDPPKRNTTGEEILRVMYSDAQRALAYADTTRATHLDGTFEWPEAGKQSAINQVKTKFRQAIMDFAERPVIVNDDRHQAETGQTNSAEIDLSAVDNYRQAVNLCNGYLAKYRDGDFFFRWSSAGEPLLLEIGDVVCLSDDSGEWRNVPVRIEEVTYNSRFEVSFVCRLYSTSQFDDAVLQTEVPLPSALVKFKAPPTAPAFNDADFPPDGLVQTLDGSLGLTSVRGGAIITVDSTYAQKVNVRLVKRGGVTVSDTIASNLIPDSNGEVVFEFLASVDGLYTIEIQACNAWGCSAWVAESIIVGFGTLFGIAKQGGVLITKQGGTIIEQPHV